MKMKVKIVPVQLFPNTATQLVLSGANVRRFGSEGSAVIMWQLLSAADSVLKTGVVELKNEDYQNWNDDEPY